jgi:membrane-bound ClpP family serine protease
MTWVLVLFFLGAILLGLEIIVPGAVIGIAGGISLLAGVILAFHDFGTDGGILAAVVALVLVSVVLYVEFVYLPKSRLVKAFSMTATVSGQSQPELADRSIIGTRVKAITVLAPTGLVEGDGRRYEAYCRNGYAALGTTLEVIELDNFRLIVSPIPASHLS